MQQEYFQTQKDPTEYTLQTRTYIQNDLKTLSSIKQDLLGHNKIESRKPIAKSTQPSNKTSQVSIPTMKFPTTTSIAKDKSKGKFISNTHTNTDVTHYEPQIALHARQLSLVQKMHEERKRKQGERQNSRVTAQYNHDHDQTWNQDLAQTVKRQGLTQNSNFDKFCAKTNGQMPTNQSLKVTRKSIDTLADGFGTISNYDDYSQLMLDADASSRLVTQTLADRMFKFEPDLYIINQKVEMEQPPTQQLLNPKQQPKDTKLMHTNAKNLQQLKQPKASQSTRPSQGKKVTSNQSSMLNTALISAPKQKSSIKIQSKNSTTVISSTYKPARSSSRAKSACRGKSDIFNSTTPIKFLSNLEESITRGSKCKVSKADKNKIKDQLESSQVIVINGVNKRKKQSNLNTTIYMTNQGDSAYQNEKLFGATQTLLQATQSEAKMTSLKQTINEIMKNSEKQVVDKSQQLSKIRLRLQHKKRSSSSLSNERKNFNQNANPNQSNDTKNQQTITASVKDKINVQDQTRTSESSNRISSLQRASQLSRERVPSATAQPQNSQNTLKKKQIMRSLMETQNAIKGQSVPGSNSKKGITQAIYQAQPLKTFKVTQSFNYGTHMVKPGALQVKQRQQTYQTQASQNASKSSSSLQPVSGRQKQANSVLFFNSTAKQGQAFARVDIDRINNSTVAFQSGQELNYEDHSQVTKLTAVDTRLRLSDNQISQIKSLNSSKRINQHVPNPTLSTEDFGTQIGTCTASGPLNPFLEQILREIPSANMPSETGTTFTGNITAFNDEASKEKLANRSMEKSGTLSKKIRSNIEKQTVQISKKQLQNSMLHTFNLTTTAAALLAASNKNAETNAESVNKTQTNSQLKLSQPSGINNIMSAKRVSMGSSANPKIPTQKQAQKGSNALNTKTNSITDSKLNITKSDLPDEEAQRSQKELINYFSKAAQQNQVAIAKFKAKPSRSNSVTKYRLNVVNKGSSQPKSLEKSGNLSLPRADEIFTENMNGGGSSLGRLNNTLAVKKVHQSLMNIVKVAQRQKISHIVKKDQIPEEVKDALSGIQKGSKKHISLNNTQTIADHLQTFKKDPTLTLSNTALSNLKQQLAQVQSSAKHSDKKDSFLQTQKLSFSQPRNSMKSKTKRSQKQVKAESSQFEWSGFLANLLQSIKPKKSTFGLDQGFALKPYQIQQDIQNKTQPLPKHLIDHKSCSNKFAAYGTSNNYGIVYQKAESRGSDYRPRIGNKQIEITGMFGSNNKLAATLQANQLMIGGFNFQEEKVTVLTEVTESRDGEKEESSALSTHRSPSQVNEDYKFGRMLGEGAYAVVRLAYKKSEGLNYAAKIYDKSKLVDEHRRSSVCREVMLMQKLKHKYCVEFVEAFETDQHVYVIMEYVQGKSLHDYLKKQKAEEGKTEFDQTIEEIEAKRILKQLLEVLAYLHEEGITHRDIKLENILLDSDNNIKLIDFGFSTCYKPQKRIKMFCGTPSYMAPEIVSRIEYYGPPADIWAAGVLLFCLLNGFFPFKGQTDAELYRRIQRGNYKLIRSDLTDECLSILKEFLNVSNESRLKAAELLQENWFLTDSSKKRTNAEIRRQFKEKILGTIHIKNTKEQICIPATEKETQPESTNNASAINRTPIELALHRQINQASPPSSMPSSAASYQPTPTEGQDYQGQPKAPQIGNWWQQTQPIQQPLSGTLRPYGQTEMNQQATQAYFNGSNHKSHNSVLGIAPPSGKFTQNQFTPNLAYQSEERRRDKDSPVPMSPHFQTQV